MDRRSFLRSACQACAAAALVPVAVSLEGCSSTNKLTLAPTDGVLEVPLTDLRPGATVIHAKGLSSKVIVQQRTDGTYSALAMNCPHKNGPVKFKEGDGFTCDWHGSTFDPNGKVLKGPAKQDLKNYPAEVVGTTLRIRVA